MRSCLQAEIRLPAWLVAERLCNSARSCCSYSLEHWSVAQMYMPIVGSPYNQGLARIFRLDLVILHRD